MSAHYKVCTATLVDPRVTPPASSKRTKIRLLAGSNGTVPVPVTKIENVGVAPALIVVVTLLTGADRHAPVTGSVSQMDKSTGKVTLPVSGVAVILSWLPTFTVATAKALAPELPASFTIPSPVGVNARATISGTGVSDADKRSEFTPGILTANELLVHAKANSTSVGANAVSGVSDTRNVCNPLLGGISTGVSGVPVSAFVAESVV